MFCMLSEILATRAQSDVISPTSSGAFISPFCAKMFLVHGLEEIAWKSSAFLLVFVRGLPQFFSVLGFLPSCFWRRRWPNTCYHLRYLRRLSAFLPYVFLAMVGLSLVFVLVIYSFFFQLLGSLLVFAFLLLISNFYSVEICVLPSLSLSAAGLLCDLNFP